MEIVEDKQMVVDMRHPCVGERRPAVADINSREFEPPKERSGVDAVERRVVGELGRGEAIVVGENFVEPSLLDQKQGKVPAVVSVDRDWPGLRFNRVRRSVASLRSGLKSIVIVAVLADLEHGGNAEGRRDDRGK